MQWCYLNRTEVTILCSHRFNGAVMRKMKKESLNNASVYANPCLLSFFCIIYKFDKGKEIIISFIAKGAVVALKVLMQTHTYTHTAKQTHVCGKVFYELSIFI